MFPARCASLRLFLFQVLQSILKVLQASLLNNHLLSFIDVRSCCKSWSHPLTYKSPKKQRNIKHQASALLFLPILFALYLWWAPWTRSSAPTPRGSSLGFYCCVTTLPPGGQRWYCTVTQGALVFPFSRLWSSQNTQFINVHDTRVHL